MASKYKLYAARFAALIFATPARRAITVIILAVILVLWGLIHMPRQANQKVESQKIEQNFLRHPLTGQVLNQPIDFFAIGVMIDNAYNVRPQSGLKEADIIYEALAESSITRLLAIFDSNQKVEKIGPVRSARPYYMDWAEEYGGIYMHVGGSPQAIDIISNYNFTNIDQIGAGETYFWRADDLDAPSNVLTSSANWLRAREIKEVQNLDWSAFQPWYFIEPTATTTPPDFSVDFSIDLYKVDWHYSDVLKKYQRNDGEAKAIYDSGEQIAVNNVIVQIVDSHLIDTERRTMDTAGSGQVFIFNAHGEQRGEWKYIDGRTLFFDDAGQELKLVPGKTWVEIINSEESLIK